MDMFELKLVGGSGGEECRDGGRGLAEEGVAEEKRRGGRGGVG